MFLLHLYSTVLITVALAYVLKLGDVTLATFLFVLAILSPLDFQTNVMIILSVFEEKFACDFDRGYTDSVDQFGKICHLNSTKFSRFWDTVPCTLAFKFISMKFCSCQCTMFTFLLLNILLSIWFMMLFYLLIFWCYCR